MRQRGFSLALVVLGRGAQVETGSKTRKHFTMLCIRVRADVRVPSGGLHRGKGHGGSAGRAAEEPAAGDGYVPSDLMVSETVTTAVQTFRTKLHALGPGAFNTDWISTRTAPPHLEGGHVRCLALAGLLRRHAVPQPPLVLRVVAPQGVLENKTQKLQYIRYYSYCKRLVLGPGAAWFQS